MLAIDADSHFIEPLDLFEKYIDPKFRDRAFKARKDPASGATVLIVHHKPLRSVNVGELLSAVTGYGQKRADAI